MHNVDEHFLLCEISPTLENFSKKSKTLYNCKCPVCGDSKTNKFKARGYFMVSREGTVVYYCHNCGASMSLSTYIQSERPELYSRYMLEKIKGKGENKKPEKSISTLYKPKNHDILNSLERRNPFAIEYMRRRNLPTDTVYYTPEFQHYVNKLVPGKFKNPRPDKRIVIPLVGKNSVLYGIQGRAIDPSPVKYITIVFDGCPKIWGVDKVNFNKPYYVLEGPFNAMFLDNAIACCGGDLVDTLNKIDHVPDNAIIVYDNDPRNPDIVKKIKSAISKGYKVVIWPEKINSGNDINDIISERLRNNLSTLEDAKSYITGILENNTYQNLSASYKLKRWAKT